MAAISLILLVLSVSSPFVHGNSGDCATLIVNMVDCVAFLTNGSTADKPQGNCCSGLKTILDTNAQCLCEGLKKSRSMGINLNVTKASTLPAVCKLIAPPSSACQLSTTPPAATTPGQASAPAPSPSQKNHGSSLIPISGLSFLISGALLMLFSRI
ncbi:Non-specific lipid transfer protein GPI-anchored 31 [Cardamine amara subsp. amara]|uniref:Non-specific lipid transfer protein GPI-anchored 31 n=1 Tax=Cardamine amara subsp. amara TaxID=228776 RepID=A0ABD0ZNX8_CARAN